MLNKIISNDQLKKLLATFGFLVNIDYPTRDVKLHRNDCKYCNPGLPIGVKPSSKILKKTGEFWYSEKRDEADSKAEEIARRKGYKYSLCAVCHP